MPAHSPDKLVCLQKGLLLRRLSEQCSFFAVAQFTSDMLCLLSQLGLAAYALILGAMLAAEVMSFDSSLLAELPILGSIYLHTHAACGCPTEACTFGTMLLHACDNPAVPKSCLSQHLVIDISTCNAQHADCNSLFRLLLADQIE